MEIIELLRALANANPNPATVTSGPFKADLSSEYEDPPMSRSYRRDVDVYIESTNVLKMATFRHVSTDKLQQQVAAREHRVSIKFGETFPGWNILGISNLNSFNALLAGIYDAAAAHPVFTNS